VPDDDDLRDLDDTGSVDNHPWFDKGVKALQCIYPAISGYCCPLCRRVFETCSFTDPEGLSREDVPPRHFGGKRILLTCKRCNSSAGHKLDSHLALDEEFRKIGLPGGPLAKLSVGDDKGFARGSIELRPDTSKIVMSERDLAAAMRFKDQLHAAREGTLLNFEFQGGIRRNAEISLLRAAYLAAFAKLGYRFVIREVFEPIRRLIEDPGCGALDNFHTYLPGLPSGHRIGFITAPSWAVSLFVQFDSHLIFLPLFDDDALYARIAKAKADDIGNVSLSMTAYPFPTQPEHKFDFDLQSAIECLSFLRRKSKVSN
jgi:hypothetical protein